MSLYLIVFDLPLTEFNFIFWYLTKHESIWFSYFLLPDNSFVCFLKENTDNLLASCLRACLFTYLPCFLPSLRTCIHTYLLIDWLVAGWFTYLLSYFLTYLLSYRICGSDLRIPSQVVKLIWASCSNCYVKAIYVKNATNPSKHVPAQGQ